MNGVVDVVGERCLDDEEAEGELIDPVVAVVLGMLPVPVAANFELVASGFAGAEVARGVLVMTMLVDSSHVESPVDGVDELVSVV